MLRAWLRGLRRFALEFGLVVLVGGGLGWGIAALQQSGAISVRTAFWIQVVAVVAASVYASVQFHHAGALGAWDDWDDGAGPPA